MADEGPANMGAEVCVVMFKNITMEFTLMAARMLSFSSYEKLKL
jgi:hypothetical protein